MIGAILGDIIGSPYEFDRGNKSKEFPLFSRKSAYTDKKAIIIQSFCIERGTCGSNVSISPGRG